MKSITVGGLPGTGTTTLCTILAERTGLEYTYTGKLFRDEAARRGVSLARLGAMCEEDGTIDQALDEKQVDLLDDGPIILEGRLAGWMAYQNAMAALKVWVTCDHEERLNRLVKREGGTVAEHASKAAERERSESTRYERYYGIALDDLSPYDAVLDSTDTPPEALAEEILVEWNK